MTMHFIIRALSIVAYFSIFLQGEHIGGSMIFLMLAALFNSDFLSLIYILSAFLGLFILGFLMNVPKTKWTLIVETSVFVLLLLPILGELKANAEELVNYKPFLIPFICFAVLYPISLFLSY